LVMITSDQTLNIYLANTFHTVRFIRDSVKLDLEVSLNFCPDFV